MKIHKLFLLFLFFLPLKSVCQETSYYDKNEYPILKKTNIHFNVSNKNSFHYGRRVLTNFLVTNTSTREIESVKQSHFNTFDVSITINHFLDKRQEIFGGIGFSEHLFEEKGIVVIALPNSNSSRIAYSELYNFEHYYVVIGHRYTFPARGSVFPFIENSLQSDWLTDDPRFVFPVDYFKRNGYSYKFQLGYRTNYTFSINPKKKKLNLNLLASIFFQSAIVKYNMKKLNRDYYPYAYGINLAMSIGKGD